MNPKELKDFPVAFTLINQAVTEAIDSKLCPSAITRGLIGALLSYLMDDLDLARVDALKVISERLNEMNVTVNSDDLP